MIVDPGVIAIFITLLLSIIATTFGYGMLTNKVATNSSEIKEMKQRDIAIDKKLNDLCLLVQTIITKLDK